MSKRLLLFIGLSSFFFYWDIYITDFKNEVTIALKLEKILLTFSFRTNDISVEACKAMAEELRFKNPMVNGFLNDAEYVISNDELTIELKHGGLSSIIDSGFDFDLSGIPFKQIFLGILAIAILFGIGFGGFATGPLQAFTIYQLDLLVSSTS